jgi:hypothetical protein
MNRITEFEKKEFIEFCKGKTIKQITKKYSNLKRPTILNRLKIWNVDYKKTIKINPLEKLDLEYVISVFKVKTAEEAAKYFKIRQTQVRSFAYKYKINLKKVDIVKQPKRVSIIDKHNLGDIVREYRKRGMPYAQIQKNLPIDVCLSTIRSYYNRKNKKVKTNSELSKRKELCRFVFANKVCRKLGYNSTFDYIEKNSALKFRQNIKPIILEYVKSPSIAKQSELLLSLQS